MMLENRKSFRLPLRTKFLFSNGREVMVGNTVNISAGGIFVTTFSNPTMVRGTVCRCLFVIQSNEPPISTQVQVKRITATTVNPEEIPGIGFEFLNPTLGESQRVSFFIENMRRNFELAATILASGEPNLSSLNPLIEQMHLPPFQDLGELRLMVERVLKSMELVDKQVRMGL